MAHLISKTLLALAVSMAATTLCAVPANAAEAKKSAKAKSKAKAKPAANEEGAIAPGTPENEPDVLGSKIVNFTCELNNTVTIYSNDNDETHIALRWKKRLHLLTRVGTTTGAQRFENRNFGLIWIGIPAKGMLLDSRQNRQLANECKSPDLGEFVPQAPEVKVVDGLAPIAPPVLTRKEVKKLEPVVEVPHVALPADQPIITPLPAATQLPAATTVAPQAPAVTRAATPAVVAPAPVVTPPEVKQ